MIRLVAILKMAIRQKWRDRVALYLSLLTAPLFVVFYWVLLHDTAREYRVCFVDECAISAGGCDVAPHASAGKQLTNAAHIAEIKRILERNAKAQGGYAYRFSAADSMSAAEKLLRRGDVDIAVAFASPLLMHTRIRSQLPEVTFSGDVSSPRYQFPAALLEKSITAYAAQKLYVSPPVAFAQRALGGSAQKTPFEAYVPGLLVFAVIMLIFSSAMSVVKEIESGTFARLMMTPVATFWLVGGFSLVQLLIGIVSVVLTFLVASVLQFRSEGPLGIAMLVAAIACAASVGMGMVVAAIARKQNRALLLSSILMFLLVLFSGIVFPRPQLTMFYWDNTPIDFFDFLPTTHLGNALNKVLSLGGGISEVLFEMTVLSAIALVNYVAGVLLFVRSGKPASTSWEGML